jgi:hypothetical protein
MCALCMIAYARVVSSAGCTPPHSVFMFVLSVMLYALLYTMMRKMMHVGGAEAFDAGMEELAHFRTPPRRRSDTGRVQQVYQTRALLLCTLYFVCMGIATFATVLSILSGNGTLFDVNVKGSIDRLDRDIPLFLGEFGTDRWRSTADSQYLRDVTHYLTQEKLSWAYWALNGDRWSQSDGKYVREDFGLMDETWVEISQSRLAALTIH